MAATAKSKTPKHPHSVTRPAGATEPPVAGATRHIEIETKLEVAPDHSIPDLSDRGDLTEVGITGAAAPESHDLDATYYDTAELDLLRSKVTLRRRTGGTDGGWHLKLPALAGARTEVGLPLSAGPAHQVPGEFLQLVRGAARGRDLQPVARLVTHRTVRRLIGADGSPLIELADDRVTATPLTDRSPATGASQWRELEAEIIGGDRAQLAAVVAILREAGAHPASSASKLARALGVGGPDAKRPQRTAGAVVTAALGRLRDALIAADRGMRDAADESVPDALSTIRKSRAVLGVFRPLFEPTASSLVTIQLRGAGRSIRMVRDFDTVGKRLTAQLSDEPEEFAAPARERLTEAVAHRRAAARPVMLTALNSVDYLHALRALDELVKSPRDSRRAGRPATTELPRLIEAAWKRLRKRADAALGDPSNTAALRKVGASARRLRYATDAVAGALNDDAAVFAATLEDVEEALDEYRDGALAAQFLAELSAEAATTGVQGFMFGRLHAFEHAIAHSAFDEFHDAWERIADGELVWSISH